MNDLQNGTPDPDDEPNPRKVVLLTAAEVAAILQVSVRAVYKLAALHDWRFQRVISHRIVRYDRRGLMDWIRRRPSYVRRPKPKRVDGTITQLHTMVEEGGNAE